ncbi:MAG: hypothetical protein U0795_13270 [Pirellulales bacterium]
MHVSRHVWLAADLVSLQEMLPRHELPAQPHSHWDYWLNGRIRAGHWSAALAGADQRPVDRWGPGVTDAGEEFFLADVLTRVWAGWLRVQVHRGLSDGWSEWESVATSLGQVHDELRGRWLRLLVLAGESVPASVADLDCVRRRAERWSDLLLSSLAITSGHGDLLAELMFDPPGPTAPEGVPRGGWVAGEVRGAVQRLYALPRRKPTDNGPWNRRIVQAVLGAVGVWDIEVCCQLAQFWEDRLVVGTEQVATWLSAYDEPADRSGPGRRPNWPVPRIDA